jgi:HEAT repeat protein
MNVLAQAYEEEHDPIMRLRILSELHGARTAEARSTLERATRASEPAERSLALEALAEIGALESVERGLADPCIPVAQTALLALMKNGGRDRVTIFLRQAEPDRAADLRRVIDLIELK